MGAGSSTTTRARVRTGDALRISTRGASVDGQVAKVVPGGGRRKVVRGRLVQQQEVVAAQESEWRERKEEERSCSTVGSRRGPHPSMPTVVPEHTEAFVPFHKLKSSDSARACPYLRRQPSSTFRREQVVEEEVVDRRSPPRRPGAALTSSNVFPALRFSLDYEGRWRVPQLISRQGTDSDRQFAQAQPSVASQYAQACLPHVG